MAPPLLLDIAGDQDPTDAILAAAGTSEAIQTISRYRRQHERAYLRTLDALREAKTRAFSASPSSSRSRPAFDSEEACQAYLAERARNGEFACPACGSPRGHWIAKRGLWQCGACRQQSGVRRGTVMDGSRLSLLAWFRAIELLIHHPQATTAELSAATGVRRPGTIRKLARQIQQAQAAANASEQLAGLDQLFGKQGPAEARRPAELSVRRQSFFSETKPRPAPASRPSTPAASCDAASS